MGKATWLSFCKIETITWGILSLPSSPLHSAHAHYLKHSVSIDVVGDTQLTNKTEIFWVLSSAQIFTEVKQDSWKFCCSSGVYNFLGIMWYFLIPLQIWVVSDINCSTASMTWFLVTNKNLLPLDDIALLIPRCTAPLLRSGKMDGISQSLLFSFKKVIFLLHQLPSMVQKRATGLSSGYNDA